jgi:oligopeptide/dipeptide ABC transporter ATP-binding protein
MNAPEVLAADGLSVRFQGAGAPAVSAVSLALHQGETLGLVGESGSGKTTLARALLGVQKPSAGTIRLDGAARAVGAPRASSRQVQYVHQDAAAALDPWWSIGAVMAEALRLGGLASHAALRDRTMGLLGLVGLGPEIAHRYPHELSGGQARRVALARVLALQPRIVILDEPTAGLDVSVQATVLGLLADLRERLGLSYLLISHDLSLVGRFCDRVAILYRGALVEEAPARDLFDHPRHPYTRALLGARLRLDGEKLAAGAADVAPSPASSGCAYHPFCSLADQHCRVECPVDEKISSAHRVACWHWRSAGQGP